MGRICGGGRAMGALGGGSDNLERREACCLCMGASIGILSRGLRFGLLTDLRERALQLGAREFKVSERGVSGPNAANVLVLNGMG